MLKRKGRLEDPRALSEPGDWQPVEDTGQSGVRKPFKISTQNGATSERKEKGT